MAQDKIPFVPTHEIVPTKGKAIRVTLVQNHPHGGGVLFHDPDGKAAAWSQDAEGRLLVAGMIAEGASLRALA